MAAILPRRIDTALPIRTTLYATRSRSKCVTHIAIAREINTAQVIGVGVAADAPNEVTSIRHETSRARRVGKTTSSARASESNPKSSKYIVNGKREAWRRIRSVKAEEIRQGLGGSSRNFSHGSKLPGRKSFPELLAATTMRRRARWKRNEVRAAAGCLAYFIVKHKHRANFLNKRVTFLTAYMFKLHTRAYFFLPILCSFL